VSRTPAPDGAYDSVADKVYFMHNMDVTIDGVTVEA
jgi:hypothetical protein